MYIVYIICHGRKRGGGRYESLAAFKSDYKDALYHIVGRLIYVIK